MSHCNFQLWKRIYLFFNRTPWWFSGFNFERDFVRHVAKLRIFTGILFRKFGALKGDERSVMPRNSLNYTVICLTHSKYGLFSHARTRAHYARMKNLRVSQKPGLSPLQCHPVLPILTWSYRREFQWRLWLDNTEQCDACSQGQR